MISQTDATISPTTTTTNISNLHPSRSNATAIHNGKGSKSFNVKKRKKFEETIIDGFAIIAFKTWEDLQDELNERSSNINNNNNTANNINNNNNGNNNNSNNVDTNCTADKKTNSKSKQKNSSTLSSTSVNSDISLSNTSTANSALKESSGKKKNKAKKNAGHSHQPTSKDKRNKTSSEKNTLKRALEAKELAEKRLSILQEKLKQEQCKNRNNNVNLKTNSSIVPDHYSSPHAPNHITKEELHSRSNGVLGQDLLKDPNPAPNPTSYSPFHINSQLHRSSSVIHHPIQLNTNPPAPPRVLQNQTQSQHHHSKHSTHLLQHQHQSQHSPPPPISHIHQNQHQHQLPLQTQTQTQQSPPPPPVHQTHPQYQRQTQPQPHNSTQPQMNTPQPHPHLLQHQIQHQPPQLHPYQHQQPVSMMSSMSLNSLPSPYSCPPSIYITDTISRQTSIIPPIGPALDQSGTAAPGSRFGQSSVLHSITPYNPTVPPHHPMYYPTLPTERSFIEFARSYTGPGHIGYPNLMNSFPTPAPNITANPYSFDRWPRATLDHQRAVNRYNSLYQSTTALPDRTYFSRPPSFPAGLFPPPF